MKYKYAIATALFILASACGASTTNSMSNKTIRWLCYEPCVVKLTGKLVTQMEYGEPNYGENPKTDKKLNIYILLLQKPVNVKGDPKNDLDSDSFTGIKKIQLAFDPSKIKVNRYIGKMTKVSGTLFEAETGHHYTKVLMMVRGIEESAE